MWQLMPMNKFAEIMLRNKEKKRPKFINQKLIDYYFLNLQARLISILNVKINFLFTKLIVSFC